MGTLVTPKLEDKGQWNAPIIDNACSHDLNLIQQGFPGQTGKKIFVYVCFITTDIKNSDICFKVF